MKRALTIILVLTFLPVVALDAQTTKKKKTKADIAGAQQKMLDTATKAKATGCSTSLAIYFVPPMVCCIDAITS